MEVETAMKAQFTKTGVNQPLLTEYQKALATQNTAGLDAVRAKLGPLKGGKRSRKYRR
jgi:hypothetical protein